MRVGTVRVVFMSALRHKAAIALLCSAVFFPGAALSQSPPSSSDDLDKAFKAAAAAINDTCQPGQPCKPNTARLTIAGITSLTKLLADRADAEQKRDLAYALEAAFFPLVGSDQLANLMQAAIKQSAKAAGDPAAKWAFLAAWLSGAKSALKTFCTTLECEEQAWAASRQETLDLIEALPKPPLLAERRAVVAALAKKLTTFVTEVDLYGDQDQEPTKSMVELLKKTISATSRMEDFALLIDLLKTNLRIEEINNNPGLRLRLDDVPKPLLDTAQKVTAELNAITNPPLEIVSRIEILGAWSGDMATLRKLDEKKKLTKVIIRQNSRICVSTRQVRNKCLGETSCDPGPVNDQCGFDPVPHADARAKGTIVYYECRKAPMQIWQEIAAKSSDDPEAKTTLPETYLVARLPGSLGTGTAKAISCTLTAAGKS